MKKVVCSLPDVEDVECPGCDCSFDVKGDEFEKSLSPMFYATALVDCPNCDYQFVVNIGE